MKLTKKQFNDYLKENQLFKLKDFEGCKTKFDQMAKKPFIDLLKNHLETLNEVIEIELYNDIYCKLQDYKLTFWLWTEATKSNIRQIKTVINFMASELNQTSIQFITNCSDSMSKTLATKFYLACYARINKVMTQVLKDYCLDILTFNK